MNRKDSSVIHSGWIQKQGESTLAVAWNKRYLILSTDVLRYYEEAPKNDKAKTKGEISLVEIDKVELAGGSLLHHGAYFNVHCKSRTYHFYADTPEHGKKWVQKIQSQVKVISNQQPPKQTPTNPVQQPLKPAPTNPVQQPLKPAPTKPAQPAPKKQLTPEERIKIEAQMNQVKEMAVKYKNEGNMEKAREALSLFKDFRDRLGLPPLGSSSSSSEQSAAPLALSPQEKELESKLQEMIKAMMEKAVENKTSNLQLAGHYLQFSKTLKQELATFHKIVQDPTLESPTYTMKPEEIKVEKKNSKIPENQLKITLTDINLQKSGLLQTEFKYPKETPQSIASPTFDKGKSSNWEWTTTYERKKSFQTFLERKGITWEVVHPGGLFSSAKAFGKSTTIKFADLLTKCNLSTTVELKEGRTVVGTFNMQVQMHRPLVAQEVVSEQIQLIKLDPPKPKPKAQANQPSQPSPKPAQPSQSPTSSQPVQSSSKPTSPQPAQPSPTSMTPVQSSPKPEEEEDNSLEEELNDPEKYVSYDAIECETERLKKEKLVLLSKKQPLPEDLDMRIVQFETRGVILGQQVEQGVIQLPDYLKMLEKDIKRKKEMAGILKGQNRLELAKRALTLAKVMENEWQVSQE